MRELASHLSSREGFLQPWASITRLRCSQRLFPGPLRLPTCSWGKLLWQLSSKGSGTPRPVEFLPALNEVWYSPTRGIGKET